MAWRETYLGDPFISHLLPPDAVEALLENLREELRLVPGSSAFGTSDTREVERAASLFGALMHGQGASLIEVDHAIEALGSDFPSQPEKIRWLRRIANSSYAVACTQSEREGWLARINDINPVFQLTNEICGCFLVGPYHKQGWSAALGRVLLLLVRTGASSVIIDTSYSSESEMAREVLIEFLRHERIESRRKVYIVGRCGLGAETGAVELHGKFREALQSARGQLSEDE